MMRMKAVVLSFVAVLTIQIVSSAPVFRKPSRVRELKLDVADVISRFSFKLFKDVSKKDKKDGNIAFSPLALSRALLMLRDSTFDETRSQIEGATGFGLFTENLTHVLKTLIEEIIPEDERHSISIGNELFYNDLITLHESYEKLSENHHSNLTQLDLKCKENAHKTLQAWVRQMFQQDGERELNLDLNSDLTMLNGMNFKSWWKQAFESAVNENFIINEENVQKVPIMSSKGSFKYNVPCGDRHVLDITGFDCLTSEEEAQPNILEVPFQHGNLAMVFVMSNDQYSLENIEKNIGDNFTAWKSNLETSKSEIHIPKFQMDYNVDFSDILKHNGIVNAFEDNANFKHLSHRNSSLSELHHMVSLVIDEQGETEEETPEDLYKKMFPASLFAFLSFEPPVLYRTIKINRPFVFVIEDTVRKVPLIIGKITDPTKLQ